MRVYKIHTFNFFFTFPAIKMDWYLHKSNFHSTNLVFNCTHRRYFKKQITRNNFNLPQPRINEPSIWIFFIPPVSMLVFTEAYGEKLKTYKYYYCATLFAYESIWFLSIVNLVCTLMNTWSIEEYIKELQNMPQFKSEFFVSIAKLFYVFTSGFACFLHWMKNMFVHLSLCQSKIFEVSRSCDEKLMLFT